MFFIANRNKECRELMIFYVTIKIISLTLKWSDLEEGGGRGRVGCFENTTNLWQFN